MAAESPKHVLVVGGAGYIGSVLCGALQARGYRVRVLDLLLYANGPALETLRDRPEFSFVHGDFCRPADVRRAMDGITDVILLAALVGDPICRKYPDLARRINETGTLEFIDSLNEFGLDRLVFMSTCSNYGLRNTDLEATEESELNPQSLYAETKVRVEQYLLRSASECKFSVTLLRAATAYGVSPRMRFDLTVNEFTRELSLGHKLLVYDTDTWRPYCHVEDIAEAILAVLEAPDSAVSGQVFNVGRSGENYTKRMIVRLLCDQIPGRVIDFQAGSADPRNYRVSFAKFSALLGFAGRHSLSGFIPRLVELLRAGEYRDFEDRRRFYTNVVVDSLNAE